jgi:hypothetical protein
MDQNFIENELIILSKQTLDLFLEQSNPTDLISLYTFYYYTAKWQKTNQPKCTTEYAAAGLKRSVDWVRSNKKILIDLGLIEDIKYRNPLGQLHYYIKLNYIFKKSTVEKVITSLPSNREGGSTQGEDSQRGNASSVGINASSVGINASSAVSKDTDTDPKNGSDKISFGKESKQLPENKDNTPSEKKEFKLDMPSAAPAPKSMQTQAQIPSQQQPKPKKTKEKQPELPENKFISYWNAHATGEMAVHKRRDTDTYSDAVKMFEALEKGVFAKINRTKIDWQKESGFGININDVLNRKWTEEEIYKAIDNYVYDNTFGSFAHSTNGKPKSCREWLLNSKSGHSWALVNFTHDPKPAEPRIPKPLDPAVLTHYRKAFCGGDLNPVEEAYLVAGVNFIIGKRDKFHESSGKYFTPSMIQDMEFFKLNILWLTEKFFDRGNFELTMLKAPGMWDRYAIWLKTTHKINLEVSPLAIERLRQDYEKRVEVAAKREKENEQVEAEEKVWRESRAKSTGNKFQMVGVA